MKKTLILGASTNPERYSYIAAHRLTEKQHDIVPVGIKKGEVAGKQIINNKTIQEGIDTITLYLSPENQVEWYDYILKTKPKRIIFNPGTENDDLIAKAKNNGIEPIEACTLVMLSVGNY
jgi:predicted CoA-binding protein